MFCSPAYHRESGPFSSAMVGVEHRRQLESDWFVQFRYNNVRFANTYHPGIGPGGGPTPEKTLPFSFVGLTGGGLRVTIGRW